MSDRSLHRLAVTGFIISFGLLPLSDAHAAPAADQTTAVSRTVRAWGLSLLQSFQELLGGSVESTESMANDDQDSMQDGSNPQDGVGIDPHGKPGR